MRFTTAFLDRDGTLNVKAPEGAYISRPEDVVLLAGAAEAVARLNEHGVFVVLVSNQRGVARGLYTVEDVGRVNARLAELLAGTGAHLDAVYLCPHDEGQCDCRKPLPGMLLRAVREHPRIDLPAAVLIGDAESDVAAGAAAGVTTVRLAAGPVPTEASHVSPDLAAAVEWVLSS